MQEFSLRFWILPIYKHVQCSHSLHGISSACLFSQRKEYSRFQCTMNQREAHGWNSQQLLKVISSSDGYSCFTTMYINHTNLLFIILSAFLPLMFYEWGRITNTKIMIIYIITSPIKRAERIWKWLQSDHQLSLLKRKIFYSHIQVLKIRLFL